MKIFSLLFLFSSLSFGQCLEKDIIADEYIVRIKKADGSLAPASMEAQLAKTFKTFLDSKNIPNETIFTKGTDFTTAEAKMLPPHTFFVKVPSTMLSSIATHPSVQSVDHNCRVTLTGDITPFFSTNDPLASDMWNLKKIQLEDAWTISKGSADIIVGISDTGVDYTHEDLRANMWVNKNEIAGNGIDDDGNGCVDDIYGCDFADNDGDPSPGTNENLIHGTHVAGTVAAVGNNAKGLSGIVQTSRIMALKGFNYQGVGGSAALLKSLYYGVNNGARVINCSWGREGASSQSDLDAFEYAYNKGVVMVVAAGNDNKDAANFSPADLPHVITVAATDSADQIATFSNWGTTVEIAAPGGKGYSSNRTMIDSILSTIPQSKYAGMLGTSMAAPHVTGLVALILSINPNLTPNEVLKILQDGGDLIHVTTTTSNKKFDYKRINAFGSAKLALASLPPGSVVGKPCVSGLNCASSADSFLLKNGFSQTSGCGSITNINRTLTPEIPTMISTFLLLLMPFATLFLRFKKQKA